ncbi:hypothetical protein Tco_0986556 [Tanacetum coccineum]
MGGDGDVTDDVESTSDCRIAPSMSVAPRNRQKAKVVDRMRGIKVRREIEENVMTDNVVTENTFTDVVGGSTRGQNLGSGTGNQMHGIDAESANCPATSSGIGERNKSLSHALSTMHNGAFSCGFQDTGDTMTLRPTTIETTIEVIRIFDRFRTLHTHNLQSSSLKHAVKFAPLILSDILPTMVRQLLLAPLDRTNLWQDVNHRVVKSDIINFPNNRQGNRHLNHPSVEQLRVANEPVLNQVFAMNESLTK